MDRHVEAYATEGDMNFTEPNLSEMVSKYQAFLAPEDPRFGEGISGWDITSEYDLDPISESNGAPIWGCMCSPSVLASEGKRVKLQPADIEAKRAHIVVRTPTSRDELIEIERTVMHELGHVLHAKLDLPRDLEEEIMHSLDHFFSKLSPEQGRILARSFQNPMARAYRAKEKAMPDPIEEKKDPDNEAPKMAEGAPRDIGAIEADMLKTRLAGGDISALQDEWFAAKMTATTAPVVTPPAPPVMGMKPEEAYARAKRDADKAAANALVAALHQFSPLGEKQRAYLAGRLSVAEVNEALEAMPRAQAPIGLPEHPAKKAGAADETPFARMKKTPQDPLVREALGLNRGEPGSHGISKPIGHTLAFSLYEQVAK
jgi:hypothetical protein